MGFPCYCFTMDVGLKLAKSFDSCSVLQLKEDRFHGTKFFHLRVLVNVLQPLQQVVRVSTPDGATHCALLKYEHLPSMCFFCGVRGHLYRTCDKEGASKTDVKEMMYGPWMGGIDNIRVDQIFSVTNP